MIVMRGIPRASTLTLLTILAGCSGGGGNDDPPPDDPPPSDPMATLDIADASITEGDNGTRDLEFSLTLSEALTNDATVDYASGDDVATAGTDYTAVSGTLTILAGITTATIVVPIIGDRVEESDETLTLTLSNASRGVTFGQSSATGTIEDDDMPPPPTSGNALNDTGVTGCATANALGLDCNDSRDGTDVYPAQDAELGRDATNNDDSDGRAGFSFTKLDEAGNPLVDQTVDYADAPWACVRDEVTGLVWETKTDDGALQDSGWRYSWYNSQGIRDGGVTGAENQGICIDDATCDTEKYLAALNAATVCGQDDWRLPSRSELLSLVDYGAPQQPYIDTGYFPNTVASAEYWTETTSYTPSFKRTINFNSGGSRSVPIGNFNAVRAVRGGR